MAELKLGRLPERTPVKLTLSISHDLHAALSDYAELYASTYGSRETIVELAPAMLVAFLESDREFQRGRSARAGGGTK